MIEEVWQPADHWGVAPLKVASLLKLQGGGSGEFKAWKGDDRGILLAKM